MKFILIAFFFLTSNALATDKIFRLHLSNEPPSIDPNKQRSSASNYLLNNLYRNILSFDNQKGLQPDLGETCRRDQKMTLTCTLKKNLQWSDGSPLRAEDFLRTYKKILTAANGALRADLLFNIKNAQDIYNEKKPIQTLGITAPNPWTLKFEFSSQDPDFEYNLASFILAPTKTDLSAYSGPYKIKEWKKGQKITLDPNLKYPQGHKERPEVEFLFIEEDSVALQLYEKSELKFLRRLPTLFIPTYKTRNDFYWTPLVRLDYVGFGNDLQNKNEVRRAFSTSLNFPELQKIFSSDGLPGCFGLPDTWFPEKSPCLTFNPKSITPMKEPTTFTFAFSAQGGEDHKRATEWMQSQWLKNAGLKVNLEMLENKIFLQTIQQKPPALFRKGVALERPTCLAALETFTSDHPENFLRLKSKDYDKIIASLGRAKSSAEKKKWCLAGADHLLKNNLMIPLGAIHFAILAKKEFAGWKINQLNQLDLSELHLIP